MVSSVLSLQEAPEGGSEDMEVLARKVGLLLAPKLADNEVSVDEDRLSNSTIATVESAVSIATAEGRTAKVRNFLESAFREVVTRHMEREEGQTESGLELYRERGKYTARLIVEKLYKVQFDGIDHNTKVARLALMGFGMLAIAKEIFKQADKDFSRANDCKPESECRTSKFDRKERKALTNLVTERCMEQPQVIRTKLSDQASKEELVRDMAAIIMRSFELHRVGVGAASVTRVSINIVPQIERAIEGQIATYSVATTEKQPLVASYLC